MRTATEYRPGRWALLDAGSVVGTTADPAEAAAWAPRDQGLDAGPLFADAPALVVGAGAGLAQDEGAALVSEVASQAPQDEAGRATKEDHAGPAYLWLDGPNGADLPTCQTWWGLALASWRRRSGRADGLPAETQARADLVQALRQVTPAAVRLVESQTVQRGTAWLGPLASEVTA